MITAVVTAVAIGTRFWALGFPHTKNFDEVYYATEAQEITRFAESKARRMSNAFERIEGAAEEGFLFAFSVDPMRPLRFVPVRPA